MKEDSEHEDAATPTIEDHGRRSSVRRWLIRIGIGALILGGVCSQTRPRYKIPAGSMLPTLRAGDHIVVDATAHGMFGGEIERGEVIMFQYPIEPSQLFVKRVIGLPGEQVRIEGRRVWIKRAGAGEFEELLHEALDEPCADSESGRPVANCTLYEERAGDHTYRVRYKLNVEERDSVPVAQEWTVPDGNLFVLGDNRNDSLDSRRWATPMGSGEDRPAPFLPVDMVKGRVASIYWPPSRWVQEIR